MIDLHAHTTISDGTYTPKELVQLAKRLGLTAVAITDHDSIEGHAEAIVEANKIDVQLIPGIEFDVILNGRRLHILGLGIDSTNEGFLEIYNAYRKFKWEKLGPVFEHLRNRNVDISLDAVLPFQVGQYMDRQAIAKFLVAKGYTKIIKDSWVDYLDEIPFTEGELLDAEAAFKAIKLAGGKSFLAHYHLSIGLSGMTDDEAYRILKNLKALGLDGMEYYYPSFSNEQQLKCKEYIDTFGFLKCGGSDFHGANRAHIQLGIGRGDFCVPDEILQNLYADKYKEFEALPTK